MNNKILKLDNLLMITVLITAFVIRIVNVRYGYPLQTHPDEPILVHAALTMIITGDLNPHNFQYPSLNIYLQALLFFVLQLPATLFGVQLFPSQLIDFHVYARIMNVIFSTATIYVVYEIGRRLFNVWTGLAAMCFLTASSLHVENSYYATVDTTTAFWPTIACLMAVMIYTKNNGRKTRYYIVGGICVGLAVSSKYTAFLAFLPILLAHVYHARKNKNWIDKNIVSGLLAVPVGFLITTPYALLDYNTFFNGLFFQSRAYTHHFGAESQTATSYYSYFKYLTAGYGELSTLLALIGLISLLINKRLEAALLMSFPLSLFLFLGLYKVYFSRNILPVIPFMALLSGYSITLVVDWFGKLRSSRSWDSRGYNYAAIGLGVTLILFSLESQIRADIRMIRDNTLPDTRWISLQWIQQNVPPGTNIGREHYTPPLEMYSDKYPVTLFGIGGVAMNQKKIGSVAVMIVSSSDYERFVDHPDQYPTQAAIYNNFFSCNDLIKEFVEDGKIMSGPTIRIYRMKYGLDTQACLTSNKQDGH